MQPSPNKASASSVTYSYQCSVWTTLSFSTSFLTHLADRPSLLVGSLGPPSRFLANCMVLLGVEEWLQFLGIMQLLAFGSPITYVPLPCSESTRYYLIVARVPGTGLTFYPSSQARPQVRLSWATVSTLKLSMV